MEKAIGVKDDYHVEFSVVIPCYKSSKTIGNVVELLQKKFEDKYIQIVLVDDCSPDGGDTSGVLRQLVKKYDNVLGIWLAKNSGQHNAVMCGLGYTKGKYIICMDDDMQTHPDEIDKLINKIDEGYDVVYAYYPKKRESVFRLLGSKFSSWTVQKLIGKPKGLNTSSFWIAKKFVKDSIIKYNYPYTFLPGLILRTTNNIGNIEVQHYARTVGKSGYDLKRLIKLWSNIIGFSIKPLRAATVIGGAFAIVGVLCAFGIVLRKLFFNINTAGWSSLIVAVCFFSGLILTFMGVIGEYIGRIFLASGNYPQYSIRDMEGFQ